MNVHMYDKTNVITFNSYNFRKQFLLYVLGLEIFMNGVNENENIFDATLGIEHFLTNYSTKNVNTAFKEVFEKNNRSNIERTIYQTNEIYKWSKDIEEFQRDKKNFYHSVLLSDLLSDSTRFSSSLRELGNDKNAENYQKKVFRKHKKKVYR